MAIVVFIILAIAPATALDLSTDNPPSATPSISQGNSVYVHGTATGHPSVGLQIWRLGNNYARVDTVQVENDNTFEYEITKGDTQTMGSGQYFVLIQHPMMNGQFDITYNAGTGEVINERLVGSTGSGTALFRLTGSGSLQGPAAASALVNAVADQNIDDTFTTVSFYIEPPNAFINQIPDHAVGDRFAITGSTNLAAGDNLMVEIYSSSFKPTSKMQSAGFSGSSGMVQVMKGESRLNYWIYDVDASTFAPDEYIVTVSAILQDVTGSSTFRITEKSTLATTAPTPVATTSPVPVESTAFVAATTVPVTTQKTPAGIAVTISATLIALLTLHYRNKI